MFAHAQFVLYLSTGFGTFEHYGTAKGYSLIFVKINKKMCL